MKKKSKINSLFKNDKFVFAFSLVVAFFIWCAVVITVSPQTTRVIKDVKVVIDESVSSQFGLEPFGDNEFVVDVTITGKKYQISGNRLPDDDIIVTALTNNVNSAGSHNLQLTCESISGSTFYTIDSISQKSINVYFDKKLEVNFVIEPEIVTNGFPIVDDGFNYGAVNLSESYVTISGPATEINRIEKVVTKHVLDEPLVSNLSTEAKIVPVDKNGNSGFLYLEYSNTDVVLTIPVFKIKVLETTVNFKNAPSAYVNNPLPFTVTPNKAEFDTSVEDYANVDDYSVGTIDFRKLNPSNNEFRFYIDDASTEEENDEEFVVIVDLSGYTQDYFSVDSKNIVVNNPNKLKCSVSRVSNIVVVGKQSSLDRITNDKITVEIDLSGVEINSGETKEIPAVVTVDSSDCWIYGTYYVTVSA